MYGDNYSRLVALKAKMDPDHFFRNVMWPQKNSPDERRQLNDIGPSASSIDDMKEALRSNQKGLVDKAKAQGRSNSFDYTGAAEAGMAGSLKGDSGVPEAAIEMQAMQRDTGKAVQPVSKG